MIVEKNLPISVCIVAGNESARIRRTLESVAGWVSEIVVVLNHDVSDGTDKIAESFGARVFREPWKGFIGQKNSAAEKCTQPWLLNIDADEVVSPGLKQALHALFAGQPAHAAYQFPRCTLFYDRWIRHGDWYPDRVLRLWRRESGRWTGEEPHARLQIDGSIGRLKADLLHYSMEGIDHQLQKTIRYADDFTRDCQKHDRKVTFMELFTRPPWRFFRGYVLRLGFLDCWQGLTIAWMTGFYTFLRYFKAFEIQNREKAP